jgi:hypothetical protein
MNIVHSVFHGASFDGRRLKIQEPDGVAQRKQNEQYRGNPVQNRRLHEFPPLPNEYARRIWLFESRLAAFYIDPLG